MSAAAAHVESAMKDCPVAGCQSRIARELSMCSTHWARVPPLLRARLQRTGVDQASAGYRNAIADAIRVAAGARLAA